MAIIQGQKEEKKPIIIFTKKSGPNLGPWAQKSILRFMRTLRPSLSALTQSSWSLLLMALVTGPFLGRIASSGKCLYVIRKGMYWLRPLPRGATHMYLSQGL